MFNRTTYPYHNSPGRISALPVFKIGIKCAFPLKWFALKSANISRNMFDIYSRGPDRKTLTREQGNGMHIKKNKMRFELASRIIGLGLLLAGLYMAVDAAVLVLNIPNLQKAYHPIGIQQQYFIWISVDQLDAFWRNLVASVIFKSIVPMLLGLYLMKPNNAFSGYCYPESITNSYQDDDIEEYSYTSIGMERPVAHQYVLAATSKETGGFMATSDRDEGRWYLPN
jgi:hypothetical protein